MRYILIILVFLSLGAKAQMVIKAHANYRPYAQPAANLLLDDYPGAAAAYSLRKLDKDYTGAAIRVRKDTTGQPEQDIGFTASGDLDTAALKSFLNARSGFVTTWYDQSGSSPARNATQSTQANQPRIALNGVIDRRSGDLALVYDGSNDYLENTTNGFSVNNVSHYAVSSRGNDADAFRTIYSTGILAPLNGFGFFYSLTSAPDNVTQNRIYQQIRNLSLSAPIVGDYTNTINANNLIFGIGASSADTTYFNGANQKTTSHTRGNVTSTGRIIIGARWDGGFTYSFYLNGTTSEIVFWNSNQSSNRTGIENNINDYYNIYWNGDFTGILDTYPNSAAAYSLRNLSSTYKGPLIRVRKDTTGQPEMDIYGDYYGNLDTVGLKNFLLTRSGFVTTWYSQGDSTSVNFAQSTQANQPRIALNGVIERRAGKPSVFFDGSNDFMQVASSTSKFNFLHRAAPSQISAVAQFGTGSNPNAYYVLLDNNGTSQGTRGIAFWYDDRAFVPRNDMIVFLTSTNITNLFANNYCTPNEVKLLSYLQTGGTGIVKGGKLYLNGGNEQTATNPFGSSGETGNASFNMTLGRTANTSDAPMLGYVSEIVMWSVDNTSNRTGIESNINTYYGIY